MPRPMLRTDCCPCLQDGPVDLEGIPVQEKKRVVAYPGQTWTGTKITLAEARFCTVRGKLYAPECFVFTVHTSMATGVIGDRLYFKNNAGTEIYNSGCLITGGPDVGPPTADLFEVPEGTQWIQAGVEPYCSAGTWSTSTFEVSATMSRILRNECGDPPA